MTQHRITKQEAAAYRACHHDFEGKTVEQAAESMSISVSTVRRLLKTMEQKAPQLFPILTKRQFLIYRLRMEKGLTQQEIAKVLRTTQQDVQTALDRMKKQGVVGLNVEGIGKTVRYDKSMDRYVRQKF